MASFPSPTPFEGWFLKVLQERATLHYRRRGLIAGLQEIKLVLNPLGEATYFPTCHHLYVYLPDLPYGETPKKRHFFFMGDSTTDVFQQAYAHFA